MIRGSALAIAGVLLVAGCTTDDTMAGSSDGGSTEVASADLVRLKQQAGMADCPPSAASGDAAVDDALPDVTLRCLGGGRDVRLAGLDGPLVINVWASYCAPCRDELPVLQQLHELAGDELTVLGLDFEDPSPGSALQLAADAGVTFPSVADPDAEVRADLEVIALPQTVFVDARGAVAAIERRQLTSVDEAADLVRQHLGLELPRAS
jgi:cytochrome c biogenesis protein CcmG, thiol:disulfide interchange protein DsbE